MPRRLLRTAGRTAVIAGTATSVRGNHDDHLVADLRQLAELKASGTLSERELIAAKTRLLAR